MTLRLCVVRHGIAEDRGSYADDSQRPLTDRGRERMEAAALGIQSLLQPDLILTSPYLRALQTAEIIAEKTGAPIETCDALANGDHESLIAALHGETVIAVGHEPHISGFVGWALGAKHLPVEFKKGSAALLSFEGEPGPTTASLEWFMPPKTLRQLRKPVAG